MTLGQSPPKLSSPSAFAGVTLDIRSPSLGFPASTRDCNRPRQPGPVPPPSTSAAFSASSNASWATRQGGVAFKSLPKGCTLGKMVGEGAANAVFEFCLPDGSFLTHEGIRLLIRVAKEFVEDDRPKFDYIEQAQYYRDRIQPILGNYVLHQELVDLQNSDIIDIINAHLRRIDHTRKGKFRGTFVGQSDWGFLVEDMRPDSTDHLIVEFKPKWLSQSPSAPKDATRCRQCAKELWGYVMEADVDRPIPTMSKPCPLALGRAEGNHVRAESAHRLLRLLGELGNSEHLHAELNVLRDQQAFTQLRDAQEKLDRVGPLGAASSDQGFALAMTLRDCTCFAQVTRRATNGRGTAGPLKIKFGDFDMKSSEHRLSYWRSTEQNLINGGFYTADWLLCEGSFYRPPTSCVLELSQPKRQVPEVIHVRTAARNVAPYVDKDAHCSPDETKIYTVYTRAKQVHIGLEAHRKEAPRPTEEQSKRLSFPLNTK
ncbi:inositol-pentakisphosphate 2-kinase-domain-containing protein [Emericellopsis atlantica]|uniref:Inositol-pentakisphosphate 2-kinase n=1 Tax=Emericellopsis atlantica TaxID=2614577 RepID=A0A9P7ZKS7_9HYPO|nr:inositol-pentakisphosphate 2-kinase-domain-containing protein [Emericellopsis atlantica]KAG9253308.1 inositol-pentakisphosphate 2-kinase-domain-containing protein [Emericellopsis atlantica]